MLNILLNHLGGGGGGVDGWVCQLPKDGNVVDFPHIKWGGAIPFKFINFHAFLENWGWGLDATCLIFKRIVVLIRTVAHTVIYCRKYE